MIVEPSNIKNIKQGFIDELISALKEKSLDKNKVTELKMKLCKKHGMKVMPTDMEILFTVEKDQELFLRKFLQTKPVRTLSGVAVAALMTAPIACRHGKCTYCPGGPQSVFGDTPQSYTGHEPSTMRAMRHNYDSYSIMFNRLMQYVLLGHNPDKVDVIIMGGTFPSFSKVYQENFIKYTFKAMNDFSFMFYDKGDFLFDKFREFFELPHKAGEKDITLRIKEKIDLQRGECTLIDEQKKNETSKIRCIGLTIETKPDWALLEHGNEMLRLGATRIELGVQTVYDDVLKLVNRGHDLQTTIKSIRILKDLGFKLNFHMMPGLPSVTKEKDIDSLNELFLNPDFRPDMIKIYPTLVSKGTPLYDEFLSGSFRPLSADDAAEIITEFKKNIPRYCRIMRVQRDIPTYMVESGALRTNLRQYVTKLMEKKGYICKCIRCREVGQRYSNEKILPTKVDITVTEYSASGGKEFFIAAEDTGQDILIGFCRLRFPSQSLREEITKDSAIIRELHVYGQAEEIGKIGFIQHKGIGKQLMEKAQEIAIESGKNKMIVISGIGVREYYRKLGYVNDGPYVSKIIN